MKIFILAIMVLFFRSNYSIAAESSVITVGGMVKAFDLKKKTVTVEERGILTTFPLDSLAKSYTIQDVKDGKYVAFNLKRSEIKTAEKKNIKKKK